MLLLVFTIPLYSAETAKKTPPDQKYFYKNPELQHPAFNQPLQADTIHREDLASAPVMVTPDRTHPKFNPKNPTQQAFVTTEPGTALYDCAKIQLLHTCFKKPPVAMALALHINLASDDTQNALARKYARRLQAFVGVRQEPTPSQVEELMEKQQQTFDACTSGERFPLFIEEARASMPVKYWHKTNEPITHASVDVHTESLEHPAQTFYLHVPKETCLDPNQKPFVDYCPVDDAMKVIVPLHPKPRFTASQITYQR